MTCIRPLLIASLMCVVGIAAAAAGTLTGTVKDKTGAPLAGAQVIVLTAQRAAVATTVTTPAGAFSVANLQDGQYLVIVKFPGLAEKQAAVTVSGGTGSVDLVLEIAALGEDVTVTANPGGLEDLSRTTQPVNVISADDILARTRTVVAQAVEGETAVNLQRTSPGMAGIFVRGLTGNKVNVFVDGVRFSNGAQRGGVNTFLDLIEPTTLEGIEVLRGTSSAQYGSDALGGSVQFLSKTPTLSATGKPTLKGTMSAGFETSHPGGTGSLALTYARARFGLSGSIAGRKTGDYNPGGDDDSHAAVTRFFGIPSSTLYPARMPDTGFHQAGGQIRANWVPDSNTLVVANYLRSRQDGANRWDQLLGGDGNLIAELNDLQLDLAYVRLERLSAGWFDHVSATYSFNTQREERVNQGGSGNPNATIGHEPERTTVNGVQFSARKALSPQWSLLMGGDAYFEALTSEAYNVNPTTGATSPRRPRVPDQATYRQGGLFAQATVDAVPDRVSVVGALRFGYSAYRASAADAPIVNGEPLWPDDSLDTQAVTFRLGASFRLTDNWVFSTSLSSGYRAPHMTDLGTLGLTGSGFEVAAPDVEGLNGFVGTTADATAVSSGKPVEQVDSEKSLNFDAGIRYHGKRARTDFNVFVNRITGNIQKQSLILPQGAVGTVIGGEPIVAQTADGAVFVAASTSPVLVRANFDDARIWGIEWSGEVLMGADTTMGGNFTYMSARDLATDLPPNIEGGTPAPGGTFWVRYAKVGQKWWVQPYLMFAADQPNLSSLDLSDRRTGASRSRSSIQSFFRNGARARGWISPGPDGTFGNADDTLIATGETLAQIQDRVLGVGVNSAPLFTQVDGYAAFGLRFGFRVGPHSILIDAENLGDANYRGISWGMDAPGRGLTARYLFSF